MSASRDTNSYFAVCALAALDNAGKLVAMQIKQTKITIRRFIQTLIRKLSWARSSELGGYSYVAFRRFRTDDGHPELIWETELNFRIADHPEVDRSEVDRFGQHYRVFNSLCARQSDPYVCMLKPANGFRRR